MSTKLIGSSLLTGTFSCLATIQNACIDSKSTMKPAFETNSIELVKCLLIHDKAVTFLSATDVSEEVRENKLVYVRILDRSLQSHPLTMVPTHRWRRLCSRN